jgi:hypothetical protein
MARLSSITLNKWQSSINEFTLQKNLWVIRGVGILLAGRPRRFPPSCAQMDLIRLPSLPSGVPP